MKQRIISIIFLIIISKSFTIIALSQNPILKDIEFIASFLPDNPVILEAGANDGTDTIALAQYWPNGIIHAFEPVPHLCEQLLQRTASFDNIYVYPLGLSDTIEKAIINISTGNSNGASSSLLQPKEHLHYFPDITFIKQIEISTTTLDIWTQEENISKIDLLWLDMQGIEPQVLRASPNILKTVKVIFTEVNFTELYKGIELYWSFKTWLQEQGFRLVKLYRRHISWGDALFVRN